MNHCCCKIYQKIY